MDTVEDITEHEALVAKLAEMEAKLDYVVNFIAQLEAAVKSNPMASKLFGM